MSWGASEASSFSTEANVDHFSCIRSLSLVRSTPTHTLSWIAVYPGGYLLFGVRDILRGSGQKCLYRVQEMFMRILNKMIHC